MFSKDILLADDPRTKPKQSYDDAAEFEGFKGQNYQEEDIFSDNDLEDTETEFEQFDDDKYLLSEDNDEEDFI